MAMTFVTRTF
jgi:hypothetical protein